MNDLALRAKINAFALQLIREGWPEGIARRRSEDAYMTGKRPDSRTTGAYEPSLPRDLREEMLMEICEKRRNTWPSRMVPCDPVEFCRKDDVAPRATSDSDR